MYCSQCRQLIKNESAAFCAYCGSKLPVVTAAAETAAELKKSQENNDVIKDDIIDLDATVRVDDVPGKKYTLDHNQFRMPEPQEENVLILLPMKINMMKMQQSRADMLRQQAPTHILQGRLL